MDAARPVTRSSGLDADLLGDGELLAVDRAGGQQRVATLLDALLELHLQRLEAADRLRRGGAEHLALAVGRLELHLEVADLLGGLDAELQRLALLGLLGRAEEDRRPEGQRGRLRAGRRVLAARRGRRGRSGSRGGRARGRDRAVGDGVALAARRRRA